MPGRLHSQATRATVVRLHQAGSSNAAIRVALPNKGLTRTAVWRIIQRDGGVPSGGTFKHSRKRPNSVRTPQLIAKVDQQILRDPSLGIRALAQKHGIGTMTMWKIIRHDLGYKSFRLVKRHASRF